MERAVKKKEEALRRLRDCGSAVVALSGGVDSALLLQLAGEALGQGRVLAATGSSPSLPGADLDAARRVAADLGVSHVVIATREMELPAYRANRGDRCFHCRSELFSQLRALAERRGFRRVVYGAIADDLGDFRPGMRAAERNGVGAPLLEAGLDKREVRWLAARAGLEVADKPAAACLASRIPTGVEVTAERLERIGRAEAALRELGFGQLRVRDHGEVARIELDEAGVLLMLGPQMREAAVRAVRETGFRFVSVDLEGYRTGSLNPD